MRNDRGKKENHIEAMAILALDSDEMALRARMGLVGKKTKECLLQMEGETRMMREPETTAAEEKRIEPKDCPDHKFYPVRLETPRGAPGGYSYLIVACPNCGACKTKPAHWVQDDAL